MSLSQGSVSVWVGQLRAGDLVAAQRLWERYFDRLVRLAGAKLRTAARAAADEEDVAVSAFNSLCQGLCKGRYPDVTDREELWRLMVVITARKSIDQVKRERRLKRGGGARMLSLDAATADDDALLDSIIGPEPTPDFAAQVGEEYRRLLDLLPDEGLRQVAVWKLEGYTSAEMAERVGCVERTIERKLRVIRSLWEKERIP